MGLTVFLFGIILNWILRRLLPIPFNRMIDDASDFIQGNNAARFDAKRDDEVGFLAGFINQALDDLTSEQSEFEKSLSRELLIEKALQQEKEQVEVTLQSLSEAVITTDKEGYINYLNPVAEVLTGWSNGEAQNKSASEIIHLMLEDKDDALPSPVMACMHDDKDIILVNRNLKKLHIEYSVAPIHDQKNEVR